MKINMRSIVVASILTFYIIINFPFVSLALADSISASAESPVLKSSSDWDLLTPPLFFDKKIFSVSAKLGGSVTSSEGFLFYSNNPEYVKADALADNGCWLNMAEVCGTGQVYIWHNNAVSQTIKTSIVITNPNSSMNIIVQSNQYALTNGIGLSDITAWDTYLTGNQPAISVTLRPGQSVELFRQDVDLNHNYGIMAALSVTDVIGRPAYGVVEDIAYIYNKYSAQEYAAEDGSVSGVRGLGRSYQKKLEFESLVVSDNNYSAFSIGAKDDSFRGSDLVTLLNPNGQTKNVLEGSYGEIMTIVIPVTNRYKDNQNFGIFIGSTGGNSYPFVRLNNQNSFISVPVKPFTAYDMVQTGEIKLGSKKTITFTLVIPALSSTPLLIGVHPIQ